MSGMKTYHLFNAECLLIFLCSAISATEPALVEAGVKVYVAIIQATEPLGSGLPWQACTDSKHKT